MTDQEIVDNISGQELAKCEKALSYLYKNHYYLTEQLVLKNNGSKEDAKDVFQDVIVAFYNNLKRKDFILSCKISTFLYSMSNNLWLKKLRSRKHKNNHIELFEIEVESGERIEENLVFTEDQKMIGNMLRDSGEKCLKLLKAFYYDRLSMKNISKLLGYSSEQIARNQKVRCMKKIRIVLKSKKEYMVNFAQYQ